MKFITQAFIGIFIFAPVLAFAQLGGVDLLFFRVLGFINGVLVPFVFAVAFIVFLWGVFKYFIKGGASSEEQEKGKQLILYGIAGFVIMLTIWGIVNLIASGLGFTNQQNLQNIPNAPTFRNTGGGTGGSQFQFQSGSVPTPTSKPQPPTRPTSPTSPTSPSSPTPTGSGGSISI